MQRLSWLVLLWLGFIAKPGCGYELRSLPVPRDFAQTEVHLLTVGLGPGIEARYGHTLLHIIDREAGREYALNWGMFSWDEPNFALNFFLGHLWYWVGVESYPQVMWRYQERDQRRLVSNKLNFTSEQKQALFAAINGFLHANGSRYLYQYFFNNCATIPRDLLDAVLGGALRRAFEGNSAGVNFRHYVYTYLNAPPPVAFFLDIVMNSRLDYPIDRWQEMFFPLKLQEYLETYGRGGAHGDPLLAEPLLASTQILNQHQDVAASPWHIYPWWLVVSLLLVLPFAAQHLRGSRSSALARRSFAVYLGAWGFFAGLVGVVMGVSWIFSQHLDLHHNANLWLLWPSDFLLLAAGARLWSAGRLSGWFAQVIKVQSYAHLAGLAVAVILFLAGVIAQDISRVLLYLAPGMALAQLLLLQATQRK